MKTFCSSILNHIPSEMIDNYTAKQLGEIMVIINKAYIAGKNAKITD